MRLLPFLWAALCLVAFTAPAFAVDSDAEAEARREFDEARRFLKSGDIESAIAAFKRSYGAVPRVNRLIDIANSYHKLSAGAANDRARQAVVYYGQYVTAFCRENGVDTPELATAQRRVDEVRSRFGEAPSSLPACDGKGTRAPAPDTATPAALTTHGPPVAPPAVASVAAAKSTGARGEAIVAAERNDNKTGIAPRRSMKRRIIGGAVLGVGVAIAGAGAGLTAYGYLGTEREQFDRRTEQLAGVSLLAVGAAAMIAGVIVLVLPATSRSPSSVWLAPTSRGLLVGGAF